MEWGGWEMIINEWVTEKLKRRKSHCTMTENIYKAHFDVGHSASAEHVYWRECLW